MATNPELSQTPITKAAFEKPAAKRYSTACGWISCQHLITCPRHPSELSRLKRHAYVCAVSQERLIKEPDE